MRSDFEDFRQHVLNDPALLDQLRAAASLQDFFDLAVGLGAERGYQFSADEVQAALQASRRAWLERWV